MRKRRVRLLSRFKVPFVVVLNDLDGRLTHLFRLARGERKRSVGRLRRAVGDSEEDELPDHSGRFRAKEKLTRLLSEKVMTKVRCLLISVTGASIAEEELHDHANDARV